MDKREFGLKLLRALHLHKVIGGPTLGRGVIFSAHRVQPARDDYFQPNRNLTITPDFLESVVLHMRKLGFETLSLDGAHENLAGRRASQQPFVCFTFDDGYRDNWQWAYPVLKKHKVPFTVFVPSQFAEGRGVLWWDILERIIGSRQDVAFDGMSPMPSITVAQKEKAFAAMAGVLKSVAPPVAHDLVVKLAERNGLDSNAICSDLIMNWDELAEFSRQEFVTIGGHTVNHYRLSGLSDEAAEGEMRNGLSVLENKLGKRPEHFSYPFGDPTSAGSREFEIAKRLGMKIAVTTNNTIIGDNHRAMLTSLPRLSLNRMYDDVHCLEVLVSGVQSTFSGWLSKAG
jgi:peptidoglycan/xylan/chitin deacetylase (PgdA/CDA1 family)